MQELNHNTDWQRLFDTEQSPAVWIGAIVVVIVIVAVLVIRARRKAGR